MLGGSARMSAMRAKRRFTCAPLVMFLMAGLRRPPLKADQGGRIALLAQEPELDAPRLGPGRGGDFAQIGEIAFERGFNDLSYFVRAFRQRFGMPPSDVRQGTGPS